LYYNKTTEQGTAEDPQLVSLRLNGQACMQCFLPPFVPLLPHHHLLWLCLFWSDVARKADAQSASTFHLGLSLPRL